MAQDPQVVFTKWLTAINDHDWDTLETMVDPEVVIDYPQSGERIRGFAALRSELEHYPGEIPRNSSDVAGARVVQEPDRWAITPGYTVVRLSKPDLYTTMVNVHYPDGSTWSLVTLVEVRQELVYRLTVFFAPAIDSPLLAHIGTNEPR